jgi:DNA invertase Pin-like site-specific DNA recombinase/peptidoglycan hydrolase-like protein with peptidoglycan-binding domain
MMSTLFARVACAAVTLTAACLVALCAPVPAATADTPGTTRHSSEILRQGVGLGDRPSVRVRRLQRILDQRGFDLGAPGVDGRFGPLTAAAVRRMQDRYGLIPDGIVGPKTRRVLNLLAAVERAQRRGEKRQPQRQRKPSAQRPPAQVQPDGERGASTSPQAAEPRAEQGGSMTLPMIISGVAALLAAAALAAALIRRQRPSGAPVVVPVERELFLEGHSQQPEVGSFRGFALATAVPPDAADDARQTRYLIHDPWKSAPVWVQGSDVRRSPSELAAGEPVVGYVPTDSDPSREQQNFLEIEAVCEQSGWELQEIIRDTERGRRRDRPGLRRALEHIAADEARGLIVTDSRSLADSVTELGALLEWFRDADAALIALDLELDTATVQGRQTAATLIAVAAWESERRTGRARSGLAKVESSDVERVKAMRHAGMSLQSIADQLNSERVPSLRGGAWRPASVKSVLATQATPRDLRSELPSLPRRERP